MTTKIVGAKMKSTTTHMYFLLSQEEIELLLFVDVDCFLCRRNDCNSLWYVPKEWNKRRHKDCNKRFSVHFPCNIAFSATVTKLIPIRENLIYSRRHNYEDEYQLAYPHHWRNQNGLLRMYLLVQTYKDDGYQLTQLLLLNPLC